jgi:nicotinamide phosphoribosyltransferase
MNKILSTDSYKLSHFLQYPPGSSYVSSYIEPRGISSDFPRTNEVVSMGIQGFVNDYLMNPITYWEIQEAKEIAYAHGLPFNEEDWNYIIYEYDGYLPLALQALPDGTVFPIGCCQVQVMNTDPRLPWLTSYIETALLRAMWYPSTVATLSREVKKLFKMYLDETSDNPEVIDFMLHDFGARGVSSGESAAIGGAAHLINFKGADTLEAIQYIRQIYGTTNMPGFSIPAAEHSTITSWQNFGGEKAAFENMIEQFSGEGKMYAVVSDSYDIYHAVDKIWGEELHDKVIERGGRLVVRPDSGDPKTIVVDVLQKLANKFGVTYNKKGYMVLHPSVRVIQGDGVNYYSIMDILHAIKEANFSVENVAFGMGGALLQKVNRDSLKYAMKASAINVGDKWYDVYKDPVTDQGKKSKRGLLAVTKGFETVRDIDGVMDDNMLEIMYYLNKVCERYPYKNKTSFESVRERAKLC